MCTDRRNAVARMMIDVDPNLDLPRRRGNYHPVAAGAVSRARTTSKSSGSLGGKKQFAAGRKETSRTTLLVPNLYFLAELSAGRGRSRFRSESVAVRTRHGSGRENSRNCAGLLRSPRKSSSLGWLWCFGGARVHSLSALGGGSISCRISKTAEPRSIESSRWKMRWGVYFRRSRVRKVGLSAARFASSFGMTSLRPRAPGR
jgi:hypothetical protein